MRMIARPRGRKKEIKNHLESSKGYLLICSGSAWGYACIEKAYKVKYKNQKMLKHI